MPRFYLNVEYDDGSSLSDEEGAEFADESAATVEARKALKALICETIDTDGVVVATHIHVVDNSGVARAVISVGAVVPPCLKRALWTA